MGSSPGDVRNDVGAAIAALLDEHAPRRIEAMIEELRHDWAPSVVRMVAAAPRFVVEGGEVRIRRDDEPYEISPDLSRVRRSITAPSWPHVVVALPAPRSRGSEPTSLSARVGMALDLRPGHLRDFSTAERRALRLDWTSRFHSQPELTGVWPIAEAMQTEPGDLVVLRFDKRTPDAGVAIVRADAAPGMFELAEILGLEAATLHVDLADALGVTGDRAAAALRHRGDRRLAEIVGGASWT